MENKIKLFLVDDDALFLKSLEIEFNHLGNFDIETFPTGEACIVNLTNLPEIIILDYHLDGIEPNAMNGLDTLDQIKSFDANVPVIMLSSQDKIDIAINCMHHKAIDYVVKSETAFVRLQQVIDNIFKFKKMQKQLNWYMERV
jgi:two-component system OmpR family response regulator